MINFGPIKNIEKVRAFLQSAPHGTKRAAVIAVAEYLIGDESHGLAHDDPYKYVSIKQAYGGFKSRAQQAKVMAMINSGEITPGQRAHIPTDQSQGYGYKLTGGGYGATIQNSSEGAYWTRIARPNMIALSNWRSYLQVVNSNIKGALRHATAKVNEVLRRRGR